jgi:hypothetical protein
MGRAFGRVTQFERWARGGTGVLFIGIGIYYSLSYVFHLI